MSSQRSTHAASVRQKLKCRQRLRPLPPILYHWLPQAGADHLKHSISTSSVGLVQIWNRKNEHADVKCLIREKIFPPSLRSLHRISSFLRPDLAHLRVDLRRDLAWTWLSNHNLYDKFWNVAQSRLSCAAFKLEPVTTPASQYTQSHHSICPCPTICPFFRRPGRGCYTSEDNCGMRYLLSSLYGPSSLALQHSEHSRTDLLATLL